MSVGLAERFAPLLARGRLISVVDGSTVDVSLVEIGAAAERLARALPPATSRPNAILISLSHGPAFLRSVFATWLSGNAIAPTSRRATLTELRPLLAAMQPVAVLCERSDRRFTELGYREVSRDEAPALLVKDDAEAVLPLRSGDAWLATTSGSTGTPKVAVIPSDAILANCRAVSRHLQIDENDRVLVFTPPHFTYALVQLLSAGLSGATVLAWPHGLGVPRVAADFAREGGCTGISANPTAYEMLLPAFGAPYAALRYALSAGQPLSLRLAGALGAVFPEAARHSGYGCTENTNRISFAPVEPGLFRDGIASVGWPIAGTRIRLTSAGEVVLSGESLMEGYLGDLIDGAPRSEEFATGDLAALGASGELYLTGRNRNRINVGNEMVDPEEVEGALRGIDGVVDCAVGGIDDEMLGEAIVALVVLAKPDVDVGAELARRLRPSRRPQHVAPVSPTDIPRTEYGKVDRVSLKGVLVECFGPPGDAKRRATRL
ncbi:MAG: acyl--CoA ligase, partial [Candidatus Eremiobacteraeota bacterium]|nr:acyl--CoA ligase [Candidatus Eremiobacteraeota bacterium]MBV8353728.1 acyl--CoA ligase [Candidatus Eremiobacteraeota bacterium]